MNPVTKVKVFLKEANGENPCTVCGWKGFGMLDIIVYVFFIDPDTKEEMITGWSFPTCQEHVPEFVKNFPTENHPPDEIQQDVSQLLPTKDLIMFQ
jgi:hypothetical protein